MVHVKILIDVKEYERLKQIDLAYRKMTSMKTHQVEPEQVGAGKDTSLKKFVRAEIKELAQNFNVETPSKDGEQLGEGNSETWRRLIREEMAQMLSPQEKVSSSLETTPAKPLAPVTLPPLSDEIVYEQSLSEPRAFAQDHVMEAPTFSEDDDSWYYLGPV